MRDIRFRAWLEREEKMVYFFEPTDLFEVGDGIHFAFSTNYYDFWHNSQKPEYVKGQIFLMQYTGLKDKNGKEIYEGDIVQGFNKELLGQIIWDNEEPSFQFESKTGGAFLNQEYMNNFEVIGNIYEQPNLLKESGK